MLATILVIEDQAKKERLAELCDHQAFIARAPWVLVFLADCQRWLDLYGFAGLQVRRPGPGDLLLAAEDALVAAQSAVVAAEALGLGSCYIGDVLENREAMVELLGLTPFVVPVGMVVFGEPTEAQKARPQPLRFARQDIVLTDGYRRIGEDRARAMVAEVHPEADFDFDRWVRAFCQRKYLSGFQEEMNRSVGAYLAAFDGRGGPEGLD